MDERGWSWPRCDRTAWFLALFMVSSLLQWYLWIAGCLNVIMFILSDFMLSPPVIFLLCCRRFCMFQEITHFYCSIQAFLDEHTHFIHESCACMCVLITVFSCIAVILCSEDFSSGPSSHLRWNWTYIYLCQNKTL